MAATGEHSTAQPLPTPSATPVRELSRPTSHRRGSSPAPSSSPISPPANHFSPDGQSNHEDVIEDDNLMPFDPRRFTPTLHASLVSEILSLRREIEGKSKAIDGLERSLDDSRTENEDLSTNLSKSSKEGRSLKNQLQLLEGGSSSALTELAKERDEALDNISDIRKRLEQSQKKLRTREEDVERTQMLWDRERESWENDRRNLERKAHVVEGRLKTVLNEIAAAQAAGNFSAALKDGDETLKEGTTRRGSDSGSVYSSTETPRRTSVTSISTDGGEVPNQRYSVMSLANGHPIKNDTQNLADELAFDEEEEYDPLDEDDLGSPEALPEERPRSANSQTSGGAMGTKARKILGLSLNDGGVDDGIPAPNSPVKAFLERRTEYQDTGIQYSPPLSPTSLPEPGDSQLADDEVRPRMKDSSTLTISSDMVSSSCQTAGDQLIPPLTPKTVESPPPAAAADKVTMASVSTQTQEAPDANEKPPSASPNSGTQLEVPMIAIHPPCSEPPSPRSSVVLPPQTKSVSCQTNFRSVVDGRSIGIQTEEIRIDQRPIKLPASLLPSAIPDLPLGKDAQDREIQPYRAPPPRLGNGVRKTRQRPLDSPPMPSEGKPPQPAQAYPGNNDNGPLAGDLKPGIRRPLRSSSLFAGFDEPSDDEPPSPKSKKDIFTDDELLNRPLASYTLRRGKLVSTPNQSALDEVTLPEIDEHLAECDSRYEKSDGDEAKGIGSSKSQRTGAAATGPRQDVRRAAMISSGAAAHQKTRSRSPSEPSIASSGSGIAPPFPVPVRLSSRNFPLVGSEGRQSPTPSGGRNFTDRPRPPIVRRPTLRRVRSAAAMSHTDQHGRSGSGSSQAVSNSSYAEDSPELPPLPFDDVTAPRDRRKMPHSRAPSRTLGHERQDSTATTVQQTSVVDAIAQTMVGEWMFKYIRRRRSFGVNESKENFDGNNVEEMSANITNSGVRHKRWVWLAPYERAIMWSSKQPTSGPALLGKSGRKFTIQSVLDVKDDNPMPKGTNPIQVNRSILILTPQRALKFTATSIERHYVWLTALSFLSHSAMGLHDLESLPPVPQEEAASPAPTAALRKNPIRDSIRVAKGKPRPAPRAKPSFGNQPAVRELPANELDNPEFSVEAADPPHVPRFSNHSRKRSNTTPRIPALRSFSSNGTMPSSNSGSSDANHHSSANHGYGSGRSSTSHRMSEASGPSTVGTGNFFDAIGTVRMEAFIDRTSANRFPAHRPRKSSSPWNSRQYDLDWKDSCEIPRHEDPFQGF